MAEVAGGSLERRLRAGLPDVRWAVGLMEKIARAVHTAHLEAKPGAGMLGLAGLHLDAHSLPQGIDHIAQDIVHVGRRG